MVNARQKLIKTATATVWKAQQSRTIAGLPRRDAETATTHIDNMLPERAVRERLAVLEADEGPEAKIAALQFLLQSFCEVAARQKSAAQEESNVLQ
jgi:hypothetical protein